jgi:hypothetical protein
MVMSKKRPSSETQVDDQSCSKVPKDGVQRVEVGDGDEQYEDPWEDEFESEEEHESEEQGEGSEDDKSLAPSFIPIPRSLTKFVLSIQKWTLILQRASKKR